MRPDGPDLSRELTWWFSWSKAPGAPGYAGPQSFGQGPWMALAALERRLGALNEPLGP